MKQKVCNNNNNSNTVTLIPERVITKSINNLELTEGLYKHVEDSYTTNMIPNAQILDNNSIR